MNLRNGCCSCNRWSVIQDNHIELILTGKPDVNDWFVS
jgi:hypothetical protein